VARWLEDIDYPAVRAIHVAQPIELDGHAITFWESISEGGDHYAPIADVAKVIAELHKLHAPANLNLPGLAPFDGAATRIDASDWLSPGDRAFLARQLTSASRC
jgi:hypothetical protein